MSRKADLICVGALTGAYGVRGEVRLKSFCADPAAIEDYAPLTTEDGSQSFTLTLTGQLKNGLTGRLGGVRTKEQADALRGTRLYAPRDRLPALPDDEFYHTDLIGLTVVDTGGTELGRVAAVHNHGATDLLELRGPGLKDGVLVPFTLAIVPTVDLAAGRIVADPPEGLFPDSDAGDGADSAEPA
ncbi:MAG: 16S rRNA processing protein RimM [Rhodobacteraceae bacterium]|nr:16S rRNA processing protein RimM [Paracoccaceae bacterium]